MQNEHQKTDVLKAFESAKEKAKQKAEQSFLPDETKQIMVIGAGMMGSGIAYSAAKSGLQVWLKDASSELADQGKAYAEKVTDKLISMERMDTAEQTRILAKIHPVADYSTVPKVDLIIEAVFEDRKLKKQIIDESQHLLTEHGIFASNTTSLPITELAKQINRPDRFIGLHFFSPVDRMPLVEIILGENTGTETLRKSLGFVHRLGKIPITVNDGPAFFTSRIFFNYLLEGITMLLEGIPLTDIEEAAKEAGFAVGPLAVLDEISLPLMLHVYDQLPVLHHSQQSAYRYLEKLIEAGRSGRKSGRGFYEYNTPDGKKYPWEDTDLASTHGTLDREILSKRLLHVVALDSYRCLHEGILTEVMDGNLGSVLGLGFPMERGGVFGHIELTGIAEFISDCEQFRSYGEQWEIPNALYDLKDCSFSFYH